MKGIQRIVFFLLLLIHSLGSQVSLFGQNAWINEFHYDNTGTDVNEFVEIAVENPGNYTLSSFQVILYNGADGMSYSTKNLGSFSFGSTIGNCGIYYLNYTLAGTSIQNGAPDGISLSYNGTLISGQFLSYEGSFVALNGPASGQNSVNIGIDEDPAPGAGVSLQLTGTGNHYTDFIWQGPVASTMGTINPGQVITSGIIANPSGFDAATASQSQIDLSWSEVVSGYNVLLAWNSTGIFGIPSGTYNIGDTIIGGGRVIYRGNGNFIHHTSLTNGTLYHYKAWSLTPANAYSPGVIDSAFTQFPEPTGQPTNLLAACNGPTSITVSWTDSDAPNYLLKGSNSGYNSILSPTDGIAEPDAFLVKNVAASVQQHKFNGLTPHTQYYFKIFPYHGLGSGTNYKTDGTVPQATATTDSVRIKLLISEVADPVQSGCRFVELHNAGTTTLDFAVDSVYLCRQSNGNPLSWGSLLLTGTLGAGQCYVVAYQNTYFDTAYVQTANKYSVLANNNGNDGLFLYYGGDYSHGFIFDAFGQINVDGDTTGWQYTDGHAVRKRTVDSPKIAWDSSDWIIIKNLDYRNMTPDVHGASINWQGLTSSNWNSRGNNWSGSYGYIPDASYIVTISTAVRYPVVTAPATCHQLLIQNGSSISIQNTGSLNVTGP